MMDFQSVIDAGLVVVGSLAVLGMGLWTLVSESSTVSTSQAQQDFPSLPKAA